MRPMVVALSTLTLMSTGPVDANMVDWELYCGPVHPELQTPVNDSPLKAISVPGSTVVGHFYWW